MEIEMVEHRTYTKTEIANALKLPSMNFTITDLGSTDDVIITIKVKKSD